MNKQLPFSFLLKAGGILLVLLLFSRISRAQNPTHIQVDTAFYHEVKAVDEVRILSWNIKMLPRLVLHLREGQIRRAKALIPLMVKDQIDIIVFQECFDARVRRIFQRKLTAHFPFVAGPANPNPWRLKTNSGVMIFSRLPLRTLGEIDFSECEGPDCYARKGALLVETEHNGVPFQVLGTHLEAGGSKALKTGQYTELKSLIDQHQKEGVPQFLCGDFNTHKNGKKGLYPIMLETLEAEDGDLVSDFQHTTGPSDMRKAQKRSRWEVIDFILVRNNGHSLRSMERHVRIYRSPWNPKHEDLSDHFAVLAKIVL